MVAVEEGTETTLGWRSLRIPTGWKGRTTEVRSPHSRIHIGIAKKTSLDLRRHKIHHMKWSILHIRRCIML